MEKNSDNFSVQDAMRLANSSAGQQLFALLQQKDPDALSKATAQAASGDYGQIAQTLAPLLASEDIKKLIQQLGG